MLAFKLFKFFGLLLFFLSLGAPSIGHANPIKNNRADEIYNRFDTAEFLSEEQLDRLLEEYKNSLAPDDVIRQRLHIRLTCWNLPSDTNEQLAHVIAYADEYLRIYKEPTPSALQVDLQLCKTWQLHMLGKNDEILPELNEVVKDAYLLEDPRLIAEARGIRGSILSYVGNFSAALEDLITAQDLYETLNLPYSANLNLSELANSYRRFGDAETALRYLRKLEQNYLDKQLIYDANETKTLIGFSLESLGRYEEALDAFRQIHQYWLKENNLTAAADSSIDIANILISLNRLDDAQNALREAQKHVTPENDTSYSHMNLNLAKLHYKLNDNEQALQYINKAQDAFNYSNNARGLSLSLDLKRQIYQALEKWPEAYIALTEFVENYLALDKQIISERNAEMQVRFNTDKIQTENDQLIQQEKVKEKQLHIMQRNDSLQIIIIILVAIILLIVSVYAYKQVMRKQVFRQLALTDELTNLSNRRDTYAHGEECLKAAKKNNQPFSIISFDADHFKLVNDSLGHEIGDKVLIQLASISKSMMRETDTVGRVGGEEFLILLPNIDKDKAIEIAQRLIDTIAQYDWSIISANLHQTVSAGVVSYTDENELSPLMLKADKALYSAKAAGRNCVRVE
ncbi:diguanylate cyclase [Paraglaciecola sp. 20A4]|uniref:tetratricopeptide repeat-containing diguanylate cyclase n=1 Tax=Paraglaciecola sp. 20A4 TaxID=2687288 RepID=UPI00140D8343|nr:diguanylate cyclase [Paraglaciecola sp. 20A4]